MPEVLEHWKALVLAQIPSGLRSWRTPAWDCRKIRVDEGQGTRDWMNTMETPERRCGQHQQVWNMNKVTKITLGTWAKLQKRGQKGRALAERHVSDQIANPGLFTANEPKLHGDVHVTRNSECSFCASLDFKWGWAQRWNLDIEVRRTSIKTRLLVGHQEGRKCAVFAKPSDTELALLHLAAALLPRCSAAKVCTMQAFLVPRKDLKAVARDAPQTGLDDLCTGCADSSSQKQHIYIAKKWRQS